jgi:hypothetical protein
MLPEIFSERREEREKDEGVVGGRLSRRRR